MVGCEARKEKGMTEEILTTASPKAIALLIEEWTGHTDASDVLDGLTPTQAVTKLEGWPYTIGEQVAHMLFWQRLSHQEIETDTLIEVPSAAMGWPAVTEKDWPRVRDEFLAGLEKSREMVRNPEILNRRYHAEVNFTVGVKLLSLATHDSYHLGQVALMRRLLGAWPPPGGGDTW
jgi:hypothetical protein